ncbi:MAG TPA: long-chain fatty acid--CoA ligase, partial [Candidatus Omnitrophota bacterium]|nr:long-chain fatty acid--CoA ligase [Candidatus Omnitrophota bacterium]
GQLVFPAEVEEALHKHPEVKEAAVIGALDPLRGESVRAFVTLKSGASLSEQELRQFCREHLAHFKLPHSISFVDTLPKTRSGKVDKTVLKEMVSK